MQQPGKLSEAVLIVFCDWLLKHEAFCPDEVRFLAFGPQITADRRKLSSKNSFPPLFWCCPSNGFQTNLEAIILSLGLFRLGHQRRGTQVVYSFFWGHTLPNTLGFQFQISTGPLRSVLSSHPELSAIAQDSSDGMKIPLKVTFNKCLLPVTQGNFLPSGSNITVCFRLLALLRQGT